MRSKSCMHTGFHQRKGEIGQQSCHLALTQGDRVYIRLSYWVIWGAISQEFRDWGRAMCTLIWGGGDSGVRNVKSLKRNTEQVPHCTSVQQKVPGHHSQRFSHSGG